MKLLKKILLGLAAGILVLVLAVVLLVPGLHPSSFGMILNVMLGASADTPSDTLLERLQVADGFSFGIFARDLSNPRMLLRTGENHLLVSSPRGGEILLLSDTDGNGVELL